MANNNIDFESEINTDSEANEVLEDVILAIA